MAALLPAFRWLISAVIVLAAPVIWPSGAAAQPGPPPAPPSPAAALVPPPGHGWFAWRDAADRTTVLLHLPPRAAAPSDRVDSTQTRDGSVRVAPGITQNVDQIAWWQHRVYMLLQEDRTAPVEKADWMRRVVGLSAVRSGLGAGWQYPPGRPVVVATLGARSREVIAFGACRYGPVALVRHGARSEWESAMPGRAQSLRPGPSGKGPQPSVGAAGPATPAQPGPKPGDLELVVFASGAWRRLDLPWETGTPRPSACWLSSQGDELVVYAFNQPDSALDVFTARLPALVAPESRSLSVNWAASRLPLTDAAGRTLPKPDIVARVDGVVVGAAWKGDSGGGSVPPAVGGGGAGAVRLFLWLQPGATPQEIPPIAGVPPHHRVVPMDGSGRVAVVWAEEPGAAASGTTGSTATPERSSGRLGFQVREVSVATGAVLYAGPLQGDYWLSMREYQMLAVMLVLVMASIVVFVLRADPGAAPSLPTGVALAEPGRRALACAIDFVPAALLVEVLWSLPSGTLLLPSRIAGEQFSLVAMLAATGLACAHATLSEWMFGRSLGKLLTGCAVAGIRPPPAPEPGATTGTGRELGLGRPAFWQCLVRNIVKWAAPVLGLFILFDPSRRHPGDVLARTLVLLTEDTSPKPE